MEIINIIDNNILDFIQNYLKSDFLDSFMPIISFLGNAALIWFLIALFMLEGRHNKIAAIAICCSILISFVLTSIVLKPIFARPRPCDVNTAVSALIAHPGGYSFPSGHSMTSFAAASSVFCFDKMLGYMAYILAGLIAFSRMYLYVHYPSDVLFSLIIGCVLGIITSRIVKNKLESSKNNNNKHIKA